MTKRLTALFLLVMVLCGCLASCINPNQGGNSQTDKYVASIRIKYATNDDKMKAAVDAIGAPTAALSVVGEDIRLVTNAAVNSVSVSNEYIYIGGTLYNEKSVTVGDKSITERKCATMNQDQRASLISKAGPGADIGIDDFLSQDKTSSGNLETYVCTDITDESRESLCAVFSEQFGGLNAIVRISDVSYQLEIIDGRNNSSVLSCNFVITMDGVDHEVTMHLYYDYDYDAKIDISAPQDAFIETSIDEII